MAPTFMPGDIVLAWSYNSRFSPDDVVLLLHNGMQKIKRIRYITATSVFVVGDNAALSTDSRAFGELPRSAIQAKIVWPQRARPV